MGSAPARGGEEVQRLALETLGDAIGTRTGMLDLVGDRLGRFPTLRASGPVTSEAVGTASIGGTIATARALRAARGLA